MVKGTKYLKVNFLIWHSKAFHYEIYIFYFSSLLGWFFKLWGKWSMGSELYSANWQYAGHIQSKHYWSCLCIYKYESLYTGISYMYNRTFPKSYWKLPFYTVYYSTNYFDRVLSPPKTMTPLWVKWRQKWHFS